MARSDRGNRELWQMAGMGMEFASSALGLGAVGWGLDYLWGTMPWLTAGGVLVGTVMGMYLLIRKAMIANRRADRSFDHEAAPDASEAASSSPSDRPTDTP